MRPDILSAKAKRPEARAVKLGARLLAVAGLVRRGAVLADIGTDHGLLPVYCVLRGISPRAIAADSREAPLARARALVRAAGLADLIDCRLAEGLSALEDKGAGVVVIAGLSGESIAEVLSDESAKDASVQYVLQPTSRSYVLRRWLCENGFKILSEAPVTESGRAYTTIQAVYQGDLQNAEARFREDCPCEKAASRNLFYEIGLLPEACKRKGDKDCSVDKEAVCAAARQLMESRLIDLRNRQKAPQSAEEVAERQVLIEEIEACIKLMK